MTRSVYEDLMAEFGCHTVQDTAFGVYEGYPYSARFYRDDGSYLVRMVVNGDAKPAARALKRKAHPHLRWYAEEDEAGGVLLGLADPPSDFYAKATLRTLLYTAAKALAEAGLAPPETCPLCRLPEADCCAYLQDGYRATHKACLEHRLDLPDEDQTYTRNAKGNFFTGALGALLGAVIATLPNFSQALSKNTLSSVLYAFIPLFSALLYRLFRGRRSRVAALVSVLLASFAAAFALELVWHWLVLTSQAGQNMPFAETTAHFFANKDFARVLREMLFSLIFMVAGFFPASVLLRRYTSGAEDKTVVVRGAAFVRNSAGPLKPEAEPPPPEAGPEPELEPKTGDGTPQNEPDAEPPEQTG